MNRKRDERSTPQKLFDELDAEFHFSLDVCATHENNKCERYFDLELNGLLQSWKNEICFMNPPYSNIPSWLGVASSQCHHNNATVVCILPCDTSTSWYHDYLWDKETHRTREHVQLRFPKGRFKFGKYRTSPKFATIIAVFKPHELALGISQPT